MNKAWSIWVEIYAFIMFVLVGIVILFCICWVFACILVIFFLIIMYLTQLGLMLFPEHFSELPDILAHWLPKSFVDYFKTPESASFLTHDIFWTQMNELVCAVNNEYQNELLLVASSLWCTINLWWFPIIKK